MNCNSKVFTTVTVTVIFSLTVTITVTEKISNLNHTGDNVNNTHKLAALQQDGK